MLVGETWEMETEIEILKEEMLVMETSEMAAEIEILKPEVLETETLETEILVAETTGMV